MSAMYMERIEALLPAYDCGICGNPRCRSLARRISVKAQTVTSCPYLRERQRGQIDALLEHIEPPTGAQAGGRSFYEVQPCGEYEKVTVEAQLPSTNEWLFDLFDMSIACRFLAETSMFSRVRSSSELGYALAEIGESRIHIFRTGKITVRRAENKAHAFRVIRTLTRVLWGCTICGCGNPAMDCLSGACDACVKVECPSLKWEPLKEVDEAPPTSPALPPDTTFSKRLAEYAHSIFELDAEMAVAISEKLTRETVSFIEQTSGFDSLEYGTVQLGVQAHLERISKAVGSLRQLGYHDLTSLQKLTGDAVAVFLARDRASADSLRETVLAKISETGVNVDDPANPHIMKALKNILYVTRATQRKLQDSW
jgi:hypothetical protein